MSSVLVADNNELSGSDVSDSDGVRTSYVLTAGNNESIEVDLLDPKDVADGMALMLLAYASGGQLTEKDSVVITGPKGIHTRSFLVKEYASLSRGQRYDMFFTATLEVVEDMAQMQEPQRRKAVAA
jgi:hypothetical protein